MTPIDWNAVLAEHERWLRTVVAARLGERAAVDDVMQEVALAAIRQKAPLLDPNKAGPWLYQLAVRQVLMYRRKMGRKRKLVENYSRQITSEGDEPDPLAWLLTSERRTVVRRGMAKLPSRDAEILLLKYTENWSYKQIADKLGISESAVEARLHRARGRLRSELAALEPMIGRA
jgi:RNA polymerase sigma-70 factor (ECF subfamily)